jgi:hypothetical protein
VNSRSTHRETHAFSNFLAPNKKASVNPRTNDALIAGANRRAAVALITFLSPAINVIVGVQKVIFLLEHKSVPAANKRSGRERERVTNAFAAAALSRSS